MRILHTAATVMLTSSAVAADEVRQAAPHIHGVGQLDIAIEDDHTMIVLRAPAADIYGFERSPVSLAEHDAVARANGLLTDASSIWHFTEAAICTAEMAGFAEEAHHDEDGHNHDDHDTSHSHETHEHEEHGSIHSGIEMLYEVHCAAIDRLEGIETSYFSHFPNANRLDVRVLDATGQWTAALTPTDAVLRLRSPR